ncbi:DNA polymerase I [Dehalococcoidia bacterium]|nr:DNA polymerase I [Dehalococcoidia bacterium]
MPKNKTVPLTSERPVFMVMDGHSIVYRAYYALAPRTPLNVRSTGEPIGAVFGFLNMLLKAWRDVKPTHWAIAFDRPGPTFRDEMYADYKAGRPAAPDELSLQFARVRQVVDALGIPALELDGFEADDIVGTLARMATEQDIDTVILSGDTDTAQLVSSRVRLRFQSGVGATAIYDVTKVRDRYGLDPEQVIDFKALKGDPSDNIPSVPGVGDKTATRLLQAYGSVDELFSRIEEVEPQKTREVLREYEKTVRHNKELVTIVTNVGIDFDFKEAQVNRYDRAEVMDLFRELEFHSLIDRLPETSEEGQGGMVEGLGALEASVDLVDSPAKLDELVQYLKGLGSFALDVVTTNPLSMSGELVGLAFSATPGRSAYVPVGHFLGNQVEKSLVIERLKPLLEDPEVTKVTHNGKFDVVVLANEGIETRGVHSDVIVAAYLLGDKSLNIRAQSFERLGLELQAPAELLGTGAKQITMAQTMVEQAAAIAGARAEATARLWAVFKDEVRGEALKSLFSEVEMPLLPVLARMERNGVAIDVGILHSMSREMADQLNEIELAAYDSVGHQFAISSPQQLGVLLFDELGLPKSKRTKQGYSTDAKVLEGLRGVHPVVNSILEYRQISKLKSTYADALPQMVHPRTGRLHTTLSQTVTATGRLSSSDPNLQNIPVRTELGRRIREAFVAAKAPEWTLLSADYSQIELRILAHISQDEGLIEAFARNEDIHAATAAQVFNVPIREVSVDQRRFAKVVNFGLVYGMSEFGLAARSDRPREEAGPIIQEYFSKYPGILRYLESTKSMAREKGYVETLMGRRRYLPEVRADNFQVRSAGERMAVNMPIQGTAADITKVAMIRLQEKMDLAGMRSQMILQVHDELIFETPMDEIEELKAMAIEVMTASMELAVPLNVDIKHGWAWGSME